MGIAPIDSQRGGAGQADVPTSSLHVRSRSDLVQRHAAFPPRFWYIGQSPIRGA
jgi:hypothetical protein